MTMGYITAIMGGMVGYSSNGSVDSCYVDDFVFNYYGDNSIYHRKTVFGIHSNCNMQIKAGAICGHNQNSLKINSTAPFFFFKGLSSEEYILFLISLIRSIFEGFFSAPFIKRNLERNREKEFAKYSII